MAESENNLRREKINLMLNEEERRIIREKAIKYGFGDCIAEYMRSASIYENIYIEELNGKTEILEAMSGYMTKIREILKCQSILCRNITLSKEDIEKIKSQNKQIIDDIEEMSRLIVSTLSTNSIHRIQQRLSMIDKYKSDEDLLKKIIKSDDLILRPSNLYIPALENGYLVKIKKYDYAFNPDNIDITKFSESLNRIRDIAMQKKLYLIFNKSEGLITVSGAMYFKDEESAVSFAKDNKEEDIMFIDKTKSKLGDEYADNC